MYAVVATGGKQLKVAAGDVVVVEKLNAPVGETVNFDVIFLADDGEITVDAEALASASVTAEVVEHFKGEKAVVFKFKKRKGYKRLKGHRQNLTKVRITDVAAAGKPAKKAAAKKAEEAPKAKAATKPKAAAKPKAEAAPKAKAATAEKKAATAPKSKTAAPKKSTEAAPKKKAAAKTDKPAKAPAKAPKADENE